ncbi:MAG: aminopeptidase [Planctomycetota bacterium]|nr:aminopeptidase [Planctomycetota bacterium]
MERVLAWVFRVFVPPGAFSASAAVLLLSGCQIGYVLKQGVGQIALSCRQEPLSSDELTDRLSATELKKLRWIPRFLEFSREELGLRPGDAYQTFLDTGGEPVSHVVLAAHSRALVPYRWCFPVAGCVPYKGFFAAEDAAEEAERLRREGWDVTISPVRAYSTLGWFSEPILSTMLADDLLELMELVFHETVHRTLYVEGRTRFNESLATHVAREGVRLFLARHPEAAPGDALDRFARETALSDHDQVLLERLRQDLETLYRSPLSPELVKARKEELFSTASRARRLLHGVPVDLPPSNAYLLGSLSYHELLPALAELQAAHGGHSRGLMAYLKKVLDEKDSLPEELR